MTSSIRGGGVFPVPAVAGDGDRGGEMPEEGLDDGAGDGPRRGCGVPGGEFTGADTVGDDADNQGVVLTPAGQPLLVHPRADRLEQQRFGGVPTVQGTGGEGADQRGEPPGSGGAVGA